MFKQAMLIDDDETCNFINKRLLEKMGLAEDIVVFTDSIKALAYLLETCQPESVQDNCPDLILLDINMPVMTGIELLERLHMINNHSNLTVVMCSSSLDSKDVEAAEKLEVRRYIDKPLTRQKLRDMLAALK